MNRIDLFCWTLILIWFGGSTYCAATGNAELFQRIGAVGIACAVLYFVLQMHGTPVPPGLRESNGLTQKQLLQLTNGVHMANARTALLAKVLVDQAKDAGESESAVIAQLADVPVENIKEALEWNASSIEQRIDDVTERQVSADDRVVRTLRTSEVFQAVVVILGTLQSGFGDLVIRQVCARTMAC